MIKSEFRYGVQVSVSWTYFVSCFENIVVAVVVNIALEESH